MAYIKIFGIKSTVKKAVDYITNPDKTDEQKTRLFVWLFSGNCGSGICYDCKTWKR